MFPTRRVEFAGLLLPLLSLVFATAASAQSFTKITGVHPTLVTGGHRSASWIDADADGDLDLHVTRGGAPGEPDEMYWNDGTGAFTRDSTNVLCQDGLRSVGATWGDFDNDGDDDSFSVSWYGEVNGLWTNDGGGAFTRVLTGPAVTTGSYSESASWADYDNDGDLDLFVANSGQVTAPNFLYRNDGGELVAVTSGTIVTDIRTSRHGAWGDYDGDGDVDLYVANESNQANQLYQNLLVENGTATFQSVPAGDATTEIASSFSASWADYDADGDLDLAVANFSNQRDALYVNQLAQTGTPDLMRVATGPSETFGWSVGTAWGDFDNDADLDLVLTNGFSTTPGQTRRNFVFRNDGGSLVREQTSAPALDETWSYGAAFGDMDADGDLDLFVATWLDNVSANLLYRNDAESNGNHSLQVKLVGTVSNRSGIGARILATATVSGSPLTQMREVSGSTGYCGANLVQHFGLGDATSANLEIRWPSGIVQFVNGVAAEGTVTVVETSAVGVESTPAPPRLGSAAHPNPFRESTRIRFGAPGQVPAMLEIFDAGGRRVRSLATLGASVEWDGRDAAGTRLPAGVYFYRASGAAEGSSGKVSLLR